MRLRPARKAENVTKAATLRRIMYLRNMGAFFVSWLRLRMARRI
jgi:hypothetical protein